MGDLPSELICVPSVVACQLAGAALPVWWSDALLTILMLLVATICFVDPDWCLLFWLAWLL
jgi:hypothetical protein